MAQKSESAGSEMPNMSALPIFQFGKHQTEAMLNMQKEVMAACEEASRGWVERVKSEMELWSDLASKLSASKSVPDGVGAYQDTVAQRMKLAAEDGQRLLEEGQKIIGAMTRSLSNGWPQQGGTT
jgi:hypothetical protein